ncbi:sesquipedalian-1 [Austrofundulus limnaeus]|uniref:Sesquipedalian n=1 Tax=Austrofundulus limnaeus TaxID=52670 RepID=A0A2I4BNW6_AUSLI|nr:PREDICTED: sesquipedalian-1-like [Austrofundulus limnaeus]XP_013869413.1 PREDICTED: sesquipedalian-1-like [Austrofundulus limnaeus]
MKIDEKVVSYFESCSSPVDKEGYLSKKGEIKTSYQKRWFVLKGNLLFYKDRPADKDVIGVIVLEGCTVQLCESEEQFAFSLVWSEPGLRTYKFAAEDQASQESWIKALLSASHSYLALLVMDMEKKYRDALNEFSSKPSKPFVMPSFPTAADASSPSTAASYSAQVLGAGAPLSSNPELQVPNRSANKKSSKMWPQRTSDMVPVGTLAQGLGLGLGLGLVSEDDFMKLHEEFGKEIKELIADWSKKKHGGGFVQEENLIDFG